MKRDTLGLTRATVVRLSIGVTPRYKKRVEKVAAKLGISVSQLVRDAIDEALLSHGG